VVKDRDITQFRFNVQPAATEAETAYCLSPMEGFLRRCSLFQAIEMYTRADHYPAVPWVLFLLEQEADLMRRRDALPASREMKKGRLTTDEAASVSLKMKMP